jgi:hypothetical protein
VLQTAWTRWKIFAGEKIHIFILLLFVLKIQSPDNG